MLRIVEGKVIPMLGLELDTEDGSDLGFEIIYAVNECEDFFWKLSPVFKTIAQPVFGGCEEDSDRKLARGDGFSPVGISDLNGF